MVRWRVAPHFFSDDPDLSSGVCRVLFPQVMPVTSVKCSSFFEVAPAHVPTVFPERVAKPRSGRNRSLGLGRRPLAI